MNKIYTVTQGCVEVITDAGKTRATNRGGRWMLGRFDGRAIEESRVDVTHIIHDEAALFAATKDLYARKA